MGRQKSGVILLMGISITLYVASKVFNKEKKIEKTVSRVDYIVTEDNYSSSTSVYNSMESGQSIKEPILEQTAQLNQYNNALKSEHPEEFTQLLSITVNSTEREKKNSDRILLPEFKDKYETIYIKEFPCFIGKEKEGVNIIINESSISRIHAKISFEEGIYYVTDLGSLNGTFVNDHMIQPFGKAIISEGEQLRFANVVYYFK